MNTACMKKARKNSKTASLQEICSATSRHKQDTTEKFDKSLRYRIHYEDNPPKSNAMNFEADVQKMFRETRQEDMRSWDHRKRALLPATKSIGLQAFSN